jgi:predicted nucleotidyltransferase
MGRPSALTPRQRSEALDALSAGMATQADLARKYKVAQSTISRLAARPDSVAAKPRIDSATERAARTFLRHIDGRFSVRGAILYGSRARGDHKPDSDADIAIILDGEKGDRYAVAGDMAGIAFDVMMETGVLVDPFPLWEYELARPETFGNPALIANIKREGLRL